MAAYDNPAPSVKSVEVTFTKAEIEADPVVGKPITTESTPCFWIVLPANDIAYGGDEVEWGSSDAVVGFIPNSNSFPKLDVGNLNQVYCAVEQNDEPENDRTITFLYAPAE